MTQREHISPKFLRCSIMTRRGSFIQICVYLAFVVTVAIGQDKCDKTKCPGPLAYYEALGCKPVYEKEDNCCAMKYNCDHLKERSKTKCYVNGKEYEIGESLKEEDTNPCDIGCTCTSGYDGIAAFNCAVVDCFFEPVKPGCYRKRSPLSCCPEEEICPENPEERPICNVNGKIYKGGEYFNVESDPDLNCICQEGYKGENVEPFCARPKHPYCSPDFRGASDIFNKCAPVYYSSQAPQTSCSVFSRCQNANDTVIHNEDNWKSADKTPNDVCYFGNMTMHLRDELNQATDYSSACVKCVCEVPPVPTCQRLPDNECDVTNHPPFHFADLSCRNTKQTVGAIYTRTNFVTLKYVTDAWGTNSNGFRLVITAVKDPKHTCKDFRCTQNEFCIETDLLCDGVNHCGDGSDEAASTLCANSEASTILGMQTTWFAIALVFLILSMGGLVTAAVLCFCKQRVPTPRHSHNAHNAQSHPPVSFPWIPSLSRFVEYVTSLNRCGISPATINQSLQRPVPTRQSPGIIRRRFFARYRGQGDAPNGYEMTIANRSGYLPIWRILMILLVVCEFTTATSTQTFVVSNTLDDELGKDYFVGPCLVNTNQTCPDEEVTFFLYTEHNPEEGQQLLVNDTSSNLADTNFVAAIPTKIIVHGYNSDMQLGYLVDIRNEYLKRGKYNLIAVDWHRLATAPCYPMAVHNVPHVGDCLAQLVDRLRDYGAADIHVIGFSLGAHVPAFAANVLRPYQLSRITGLDPAMPLFITVNKDEKLDASDAEFVDVLHTNAFIQGKIEPSGHIDFYMNGGVNQPGCWEHGNPFGCNHHRAAEYFAESINSKIGFWGWPCYGFVAYLLGLCPPRHPAVLMGEDVNKRFRGFHLVKTRAQSPFAEGMFTVEDLYQQDLYQ